MKIQCPHCHKRIQSGFSFCPNCGNNIEAYSHTFLQDAPRSLETGKGIGSTPSTSAKQIFGLLIVFGLAVLVVGLLFLNSESPSGHVVKTVKPSSPLLPNSTSLISQMKTEEDPRVQEVAEVFSCSCGQCNEDDLRICSCPTASAQRSFILEQFQNGLDVEAVKLLVYRKYGHVKPEYRDAFQQQEADNANPQ